VSVSAALRLRALGLSFPITHFGNPMQNRMIILFRRVYTAETLEPIASSLMEL
jgi:hypothetical protein